MSVSSPSEVIPSWSRKSSSGGDLRSSESPLDSLLCPDSVGQPSLPLLLLLLSQREQQRSEALHQGKQEGAEINTKPTSVWSWIYSLTSRFHMLEVVES